MATISNERMNYQYDSLRTLLITAGFVPKKLKVIKDGFQFRVRKNLDEVGLIRVYSGKKRHHIDVLNVASDVSYRQLKRICYQADFLS